MKYRIHIITLLLTFSIIVCGCGKSFQLKGKSQKPEKLTAQQVAIDEQYNPQGEYRAHSPTKVYYSGGDVEHRTLYLQDQFENPTHKIEYTTWNKISLL